MADDKPEGIVAVPFTWGSAFLVLFLIAVGFAACYLTVVKTVEVPKEVKVPVYMLNESFNCTKICRMPYGQSTGCEDCHVECTSFTLFGRCYRNNIGWIYQTASSD